MPQFLHLPKSMKTDSIHQACEVNEMIYYRSLAKYLSHTKYSTNISYYLVTSQNYNSNYYYIIIIYHYSNLNISSYNSFMMPYKIRLYIFFLPSIYPLALKSSITTAHLHLYSFEVLNPTPNSRYVFRTRTG